MKLKEELSKLFSKEKIAEIKSTLLKFTEEEKQPEVKMEDVTLKDGSVLMVEKMEVGSPATMTTADGVIPAPDGEYVAENGNVITVMGGLIAEIATAEEEAPEASEATPTAPTTDMAKELAELKQRLAALEDKNKTVETKMAETNKGLAVALSAVNAIVESPVSLSLEAQRPAQKEYKELTALEKFKLRKQNSFIG